MQELAQLLNFVIQLPKKITVMPAVLSVPYSAMEAMIVCTQWVKAVNT